MTSVRFCSTLDSCLAAILRFFDELDPFAIARAVKRYGAWGGSAGRFVIDIPISDRSLPPRGALPAVARLSRRYNPYQILAISNPGLIGKQVRLPPRAKHMKTSGMPGDLLVLLESGEHRPSLVQAKKTWEIAGGRKIIYTGRMKKLPDGEAPGHCGLRR